MDEKINKFLEKDTFLKVVYTDSVIKVDGYEKTKAFYGTFEDSTNEFLILKYNNSNDRFFIKIDSIITFSEETKNE